MNAFQEACARSYADGDFAYMIAEREIPLVQMLDGCGDTLFRFLMIELGADEGCESQEDALNRITTATLQIEQVRAAIEAL
jgi:hypothetical protein